MTNVGTVDRIIRLFVGLALLYALGVNVTGVSIPVQAAETGTFLVAAYRRPDFRVDVTLNASGNAIAGGELKGTVNARYLFGTPMSARPVSWKFDVWQGGDVPAAISEKYSGDRWAFVARDDDEGLGRRRSLLPAGEGRASAFEERLEALALVSAAEERERERLLGEQRLDANHGRRGIVTREPFGRQEY